MTPTLLFKLFLNLTFKQMQPSSSYITNHIILEPLAFLWQYGAKSI